MSYWEELGDRILENTKKASEEEKARQINSELHSRRRGLEVLTGALDRLLPKMKASEMPEYTQGIEAIEKYRVAVNIKMNKLNQGGLKKMYNEEFKPLYEQGKYKEALELLIPNFGMRKYFSIEEGKKMYDLFAEELKPIAKKLKSQLEKSLGVDN